MCLMVIRRTADYPTSPNVSTTQCNPLGLKLTILYVDETKLKSMFHLNNRK